MPQVNQNTHVAQQHYAGPRRSIPAGRASRQSRHLRYQNGLARNRDGTFLINEIVAEGHRVSARTAADVASRGIARRLGRRAARCWKKALGTRAVVRLELPVRRTQSADSARTPSADEKHP
jgi:hypothetical protein